MTSEYLTQHLTTDVSVSTLAAMLLSWNGDGRSTAVAYNIVFSVLDFCASEIRSRTALDATALGDLPSFLAMTMSGSCCLASSRSRRTSSRTPLLLHDPCMSH